MFSHVFRSSYLRCYDTLVDAHSSGQHICEECIVQRSAAVEIITTYSLHHCTFLSPPPTQWYCAVNLFQTWPIISDSSPETNHFFTYIMILIYKGHCKSNLRKFCKRVIFFGAFFCRKMPFFLFFPMFSIQKVKIKSGSFLENLVR